MLRKPTLSQHFYREMFDGKTKIGEKAELGSRQLLNYLVGDATTAGRVILLTSPPKSLRLS